MFVLNTAPHFKSSTDLFNLNTSFISMLQAVTLNPWAYPAMRLAALTTYLWSPPYC